MDRNWIVWNTDTKSIYSIGTEEKMVELKCRLNKQYQTNAYVAREFKDE